MINKQKFRHFMRATLLSLLFLLTISCGIPRESDVKIAFQQEHPSYNILDVHVDEGDMFSVYFHIVYRKPQEEKIHGEIWLYMKDEKGNYKLHSKWTLPDGKAHED
jgi:hypothetical protein